MIDFEDICDGIAAAYANPGTPTSEVPIRASYGQAPNSIPALPCCVVMPQDGEVTYESSNRTGEHNIDLNFYLSKSPGDLVRVETSRQRWLPYLLDALHSAVQVGQGGSGGVQKALPTGYEFTELPYAGEQYDAIVIHLRVWTSETVVLVP